MLIEFSVKNYRSFWQTQTLSMAAGTTRELLESNCFQPSAKELPRLLRSAVIYGPNGCGKSNLVKALGFMQDFVLSSAKDRQEGDRIDLQPFFLHPEGPTLASEFEVMFLDNGIRYQYGFAAIENQVTREWLLAYPEKREQCWFERSYDSEKGKEEWYLGPKLMGQKKTWQKSTRSNALFLSTAVQLNSEQLKPIISWFQRLVVIEHGELITRDLSADSCENKEGCADILQFLKNGGIDVDGITVKERKFDEIKFPFSVPDEIKRIIQKDIEGKSFKEVLFKHQLKGSDHFAMFPLKDESDGTQKLFAYAALWLDLLKEGLVVVIDELDNSFHPHLVRYLLKLVHNSTINTANGQLIFSTHDTTILDTQVLRRDQIWFMEKDDNQTTHLYPLSDFHPRKHEALEKGYLQGRYGALPYIGEIKL
jgi:AAA15 family ATPase/GTPase